MMHVSYIFQKSVTSGFLNSQKARNPCEELPKQFLIVHYTPFEVVLPHKSQVNTLWQPLTAHSATFPTPCTHKKVKKKMATNKIA